jgi:hypothetical protein
MAAERVRLSDADRELLRGRHYVADDWDTA